MKRAAIILALGLMVLGTGRSGLAQQDDRSEAAEQNESSSPRARAPLTILQINDVYSTVPIDGAGGLSRVATLKQNLAAARRTPLLVLAGDFLSPSVASSVFKGEQMVAALNAAGLDLATLGNHEFDFGTDLLIQRMGEARWQWVVSNVIDTNTGKPIGGAAPYVVKTFGTLKVGFIGLCLTTTEISRDKLTHVRLVDPLEAAGEVPAGAAARRRQRHRRDHAPRVRGRSRACRSGFRKSTSSSVVTSTTRSPRPRTAR